MNKADGQDAGAVGRGVPRGYKQTEVGVIPEDWRIRSLGDITTLMTNGFVGTATSHYAPNDCGVLYLQGYNVKENSFDLHGVKYVTEDFHRAHMKSCLREGDLLTIQTGDVGLTTIVPKAQEGSNCHALVISRLDRNKASPAYISYYMNSKPGRSRLKLIETGTTMKHLNVGDMLQFAVPMPSVVAEQAAIAEALSDADALIESLAQLLAKKRDLKQGAMQELLTGKRRLPGFSKNWLRKPLAEIFSFSGGFTASRDQLSSSGHCYLHYGDIHTSNKTHIDLQIEQADIPRLDVSLSKVTPTSLIEDGDVVFVDASEDDEGTSRHVVVLNPNATPFISGLHTIVAKGSSDVLYPLYRRYCFQTLDVKAQFRFYAVGTKVSGISKTNIGKIAILVPPIDEQTAIATILSDMDTDITTLESKLTKARHLKQGMMQALLTGRIRLI